LLVSVKKIRFYILFITIYFLKKYYFCYIVSIIEKDKYRLLQYESVKYILFIPIFQSKFDKNYCL